MSDEKPGHLEHEGEGLSLAKAFSECLETGVVCLDAQHRILTVSESALRLLGRGKTEELGRSLEDLPGPLKAAVRGGRGPRSVEHRVNTPLPDGQTHLLGLTVVPLQPGSSDSGLVLLLRDLSALERLEPRLRQLGQLASAGTLFAGMAHEIKNALVPLHTFLQLLLEKDPKAELAETVRHELSRVESIVSRILRFAGPGRPTFARVSLHHVLGNAVRLVGPRMKSKDVTLSQTFRADPDTVDGDQHQLQQALVNLLLNALEAMGPEGTLTLTTESVPPEPGKLREGATPSQLRINIHDTGPGIPPETLPHIFEPFFTTKSEGTGLGLAITRRIVQEHRGEISVQSRRGHGTTFAILLPASGAQT